MARLFRSTKQLYPMKSSIENWESRFRSPSSISKWRGASISLYNGSGFPGHFLVERASDDHDVIIDPFNLGRILTLNDCQELLDQARTNGRVQMNASLFQPSGEAGQLYADALQPQRDLYGERPISKGSFSDRQDPYPESVRSVRSARRGICIYAN